LIIDCSSPFAKILLNGGVAAPVIRFSGALAALALPGLEKFIDGTQRTMATNTINAFVIFVERDGSFLFYDLLIYCFLISYFIFLRRFRRTDFLLNIFHRPDASIYGR